MSNDRSRDGLIRFLDYLGEKGLLNPSTASTRKAAVVKIFSILGEEETRDVTSVDLDQVMTRFHNLEGQNYSPGSLTTYQSRLRSALDDFEKYLENPLGFRPTLQSKKKDARAVPKPAKSAEGNETIPPNVSKPSPSYYPESSFSDSTILPIALRPDLVVRIQGLPFDLTVAEANKLAAVIKAMAATE